MASDRLSNSLNDSDVKFWVNNIENNLQPEGKERRSVELIFSAAEVVVHNLSLLHPNVEQQRTGAIVAVASIGENPFIEIRQVGVVSGGKIDKYCTFVFGKVIFVAQSGSKSSGKNINLSTAKQLRIGNALVPKGAIRVENCVVGMSGFSPEDDEAGVLAILQKSGRISPGQTMDLALGLNNKRCLYDLNRILK